MSRTFSMNSGSVESLKVSVRCGCGSLVQRFRDHGLHLRIPDASRRSGARLTQQAVQPQFEKPAAPLAHRLRRHAQLTHS
jgi:hypothetical protein